jgi:hypothetical protein
MRMKLIFKTFLVAALAGGLVGALLRKYGAQSMGPGGARPSDVPTVNPVTDADPNVEEPLQDSDLRVAQNAPF